MNTKKLNFKSENNFIWNAVRRPNMFIMIIMISADPGVIHLHIPCSLAVLLQPCTTEKVFFLNEYLLLCCSCSVKAELTVYHHDQWSGEPANYIKMVSGSPNRWPLQTALEMNSLWVGRKFMTSRLEFTTSTTSTVSTAPFVSEK